MKHEAEFQHDLIEELEAVFPGCVILKNDANYIQGFPDLLVLYKNKWAALECKKHEKAIRQPNQEFYICKLDMMSFARFIFPENKEKVIYELQQAFRS